jgi:hypothetical protein
MISNAFIIKEIKCCQDQTIDGCDAVTQRAVIETGQIRTERYFGLYFLQTIERS